MRSSMLQEGRKSPTSRGLNGSSRQLAGAPPVGARRVADDFPLEEADPAAGEDDEDGRRAATLPPPDIERRADVRALPGDVLELVEHEQDRAGGLGPVGHRVERGAPVRRRQAGLAGLFGEALGEVGEMVGAGSAGRLEEEGPLVAAELEQQLGLADPPPAPEEEDLALTALPPPLEHAQLLRAVEKASLHSIKLIRR